MNFLRKNSMINIAIGLFTNGAGNDAGARLGLQNRYVRRVSSLVGSIPTQSRQSLDKYEFKKFFEDVCEASS